MDPIPESAEERPRDQTGFLAEAFRGLQAGGEARRRALDALYRREARGMAIRLRASWHLPTEDIDELIQDPFIRLCKARPTPDEIAFPAAYLRKMMRNCVIDHWRKPPTVEASGLATAPR